MAGDRSGQAAADPAPLLGGAAGARAAAERRRQAGAGDRRRALRPAVQGAGVGGAAVLRLPAAVVPAVLALRDGARRGLEAGGPGAGEAPLLHPPVSRGDLAGELRRDQSGGVEARRGDRRREPRARPAEPLRRRRQGPHRARRRVGVRAREEPRHDAGRGGVRERRDAAPSVRAAHEEGVRASAADRPAVHQQVLHARPQAGQLVRPLLRGRGPHRVPGLVAQPAARARPPDLGRLRHPGRAEGGRRDARRRRRRDAERPRLLRRRRAARGRGRGHAGAGRRAPRERDAARDAPRLPRLRATSAR